MGPLKSFEKWLYPALVAWVAAMAWQLFVIWPEHPFVSTFDAAVAYILTGIAAVATIVAYVLARWGR